MDEGIYLHNGVLGTTVQVKDIKAFLATLPNGTLVVEQLAPSDTPKYVARTWAEVVTPPQRERFSLRDWNEFVKYTAEYVYADLLDEYSDELESGDIYGEDDYDMVLPWNEDVKASARRIITRYLLESEWSKSREGQEKAIAFSQHKPSHDKVVSYHKLLYQTIEITDHVKHRKARFLASSVYETMKELQDYRRNQNAEIRSTSRRSRRRSF